MSRPGPNAHHVISNAGLEVALLGNRTQFATSQYFCGNSGRFCGKNYNLFSAPAEPASSERSLFVERWVLGPWRHGPQSPSTHFAPATVDRMVQFAKSTGSMAESDVRKRWPVFRREEPTLAVGRRLHQVMPMRFLPWTGVWEPEDGALQTFEGYGLMGMTSPGKVGPKMPGIAHGGGCCVHVMPDERLGTPEVLIGVSHYHSLDYQYLQQFYAFRHEPPFDIVALSDPFCFTGSSWKKRALLLHQNVTYPCAFIQMTMSIAQKPGDGATLLFGVGMNDCEGRIVQVRTHEVLEMLFTRRRGDP